MGSIVIALAFVLVLYLPELPLKSALKTDGEMKRSQSTSSDGYRGSFFPGPGTLSTPVFSQTV